MKIIFLASLNLNNPLKNKNPPLTSKSKPGISKPQPSKQSLQPKPNKRKPVNIKKTGGNFDDKKYAIRLAKSKFNVSKDPLYGFKGKNWTLIGQLGIFRDLSIKKEIVKKAALLNGHKEFT